MSSVRIALANIRYPESPEHSVTLAEAAIREAAHAGAAIICFPECFVPGYRWPGREVARPDAAFLERAWAAVAGVAADVRIGVILGTERIDADGIRLTALVINPDGSRAGFQDKVQLDPSEESLYVAGTERRVFRLGALTFGVSICHEGFRYPETVRWAARQGAQVVFHPFYDEATPHSYRPSTFGDPGNTFHEHAIRCRAAENTCFVASVNCASADSPTTSVIAAPDGGVLSYQPYGQEGLLVADLDLAQATGLLARRLRPAVNTES